MSIAAIEHQLSQNVSPLDLKIIDNSCGAGYFLLSSLHYLTEKVWSEIDKFDDVKDLLEQEYEITLNEIRKHGICDLDKKLVLKRILLKKCIYGVDISDIAINITKMNLWIDTFILGRSVSFINNNIKVGNALIGYTKGGFFTVLEEKFQKNVSLWSILINKVVGIVKDVYNRIHDIDDEIKNSLRLIFSLIKIYELHLTKSIKFDQEIYLDVYIVIGLIQNIVNQKITDENQKIIEEVKKISEYYRFFHYGIEFPDVQDGFHIVIGNPPWERVVFDEEQFFSKYVPDYRKLSFSARNRVRAEIISSPLNVLLNEERDNTRKLNAIYRNDLGRFCIGGDSNLFKYFLTFNLCLMAKNGNLTYMTPVGLWHDFASQLLRKFIFSNCAVNFIYNFENKKRFTDLSSKFQFSIFQISNNNMSEFTNFKIKFMIQDSDPIIKDMTADIKLSVNNKNIAYKGFDLSVSKIRKFSPIYESIVNFKSNEEFSLFGKMFNRCDVLSEEYIKFISGLEIISEIKEFFEENVNNGNENDYVFIYKGANIYQFNSRYFEHENSRAKSKLLWTSKENIDKIIPNENLNNTNVLFRRIFSSVDSRTMLSTLMPKNCYCDYSVFMSYDNNRKTQMSIYKKLFIVSVFNSLPFDFLLRKFVSLNVTNSCLYQCPMPQPSEKEILTNPVNLLLAMNACILIVKNNPNDF
ncbi:class I SAM-dependent DNA methyltransferase, partial [Borrelia persica]|uniref:class I SAM-dependent DNA methyltransferase n=1 Tax=Borrelia persica TaxID=44448 RepID=UPI00190FBABF